MPAALLPLASCGGSDGVPDHAVLTVEGQDVLAVQAPGKGSTYQGTDAMGLAWSMGPDGADADSTGLRIKPPDTDPFFTITVTASVHGHAIAHADLTRRWLAPGVTTRALRPADSKVWGELFIPPPGTPKRPAVLVFGGSEGGEGQDLTAGRILAALPGADAKHVLVMGYSRGTEAALLPAQDMPTLFHGAVLYSPGDTVGEAFPNGDAAWTLAGAPVTVGSEIPTDHVSGPVLAVAGDADALWDSASAAHAIDSELTKAGNPYPHQVLEYPGAGHLVGTFPYLPQSTNPLHPLLHTVTKMGGTRSADNAAQADSWSKVLSLLASLRD